MPAGSGPSVTRTTGTSATASEVAIASTPVSNWQSQAGNLISASVNFTPGTGQTSTTLRIRQGSGVGGTLVGIAHTVTTVAAAPIELAIDELDTSAFGLSQQGGQYTLTIQTNAAGPGTVNAGLVELETCAPLI